MLDLLAQAVQRLEERGQDGLEDLLRDHPDRQSDVRRLLQQLGHVGMLGAPGASHDAIPARLGEFVLRERLGSGGMGVVYAAEQPSLRRQVALKLIRPEHLFFPNARERFRREVEAIATLQHPSIVRVHSASVEGELPYFTMERVEGTSLDRLLARLRQQPLHRVDESSVRAVLAELGGGSEAAAAETSAPLRGWVELCCEWVHALADAVDYAHRRGVLHRDIKPSNVMITWSLRPMLLDFGLASTRGNDKITHTGAQVGSLPYMAPEQVRGETADVGERTDVYGLGVLLYELLTFVNPFHEGSSSEDETRQRIVAAAPPPVRHWNPGVSWDAETVCHCAMAPEPAQRYPTAGSLAQDLANVLHGRPIAARRPGALLRLRRWMRRHPAATAAAGMGVLLLIATPSAFAWSEYRLRQEITTAKNDAEHEKENALGEAATREDILTFFREELLEAVSPGKAGKDATMRQVLDVASTKIAGRFDQRPVVEIEIRSTIGHTYRRLGVLDRAEEHLRRALELARQHLGPSARETLAIERKYIMARTDRGDQSAQEEALRRNWATCRATFGDDDPDTLAAANNLGLLLTRIDEHDEALAILRDVVERRLRLLGEDHEDTQTSMCNLGIAYYDLGRYDEAEPWARRELELCSKRAGDDDPGTLLSRQNYANVLTMMGRAEEALAQTEKILASQERVLGPGHPKRLNTLYSKSRLLAGRNDHEGSLAVLQEIEAKNDQLAPDDRLMLIVAVARAEELRATGDLAEARAAVERVLAARSGNRAEDGRVLLDANRIMVNVLIDEGRREEAATLLRELIASEAGKPVRGHLRVQLAKNLRAMGRREECERELLANVAFLEQYAPSDPALLKSLEELSGVYTDAGRAEEAAAVEARRGTWMDAFRQRTRR